MIYVSHDAGEVGAIADHVIVLDRGRVTGSGAPSTILQR
jgi:ABC-type molybdate transport system ATPase subunit